jgi:hypothetical protein
MPSIPHIIIEQGFESIGLLSTLYVVKSNQEFFAGLFTKDDRLYMVVQTGDSEHIFFPIQEKQMMGLFKGEHSLMDLARQAGKIETIPFDTHANEKRTRILFRMFYRMALGKIKTIPNAFYIWNEYSFSRELKRHLV